MFEILGYLPYPQAMFWCKNKKYLLSTTFIWTYASQKRELIGCAKCNAQNRPVHSNSFFSQYQPNFIHFLIDIEVSNHKQNLVYGCLFVCVEVLQPSQPNGVMSSAISLPNHTFTGQA